MKRLALVAAAAGMFVGSAGVALARDLDRGMSEGAPGEEMHEHGSVPGSPGASGYARGHLYNRFDRDRGEGDFDRDDMRRHHRDRDFDRDGMTRHRRDRDFDRDRD